MDGAVYLVQLLSRQLGASMAAFSSLCFLATPGVTRRLQLVHLRTLEGQLLDAVKERSAALHDAEVARSETAKVEAERDALRRDVDSLKARLAAEQEGRRKDMLKAEACGPSGLSFSSTSMQDV